MGELFRFCIVGTSVMVVNQALFNWFFSLGAHYNFSAVLAFLFASVLHFSLQRYFTFRGHRGSFSVQVRRYLVGMAVSMVVAVGSLNLLIVMGFHINSAWLASTLTAIVFSYFGQKYFVFGR